MNLSRHMVVKMKYQFLSLYITNQTLVMFLSLFKFGRRNEFLKTVRVIYQYLSNRKQVIVGKWVMVVIMSDHSIFFCKALLGNYSFLSYPKPFPSKSVSPIMTNPHCGVMIRIERFLRSAWTFPCDLKCWLLHDRACGCSHFDDLSCVFEWLFHLAKILNEIDSIPTKTGWFDQTSKQRPPVKYINIWNFQLQNIFLRHNYRYKGRCHINRSLL